MAATTTTTASITIHNPNRHLIIASAKNPTCPKLSQIPISQPSKQLPNKLKLSATLAKNTAITATVLSTITSSPLALAAKKIAESPQQDNRTLALLLPLIPAIGWVLYNISGPALNQLERMRSNKGVIFGLGLGGLGAAASALYVPSSAAAATEVVEKGGESGSNQGLLVLIVAAVMFLEVLLLSSMTSKYESEKKGEGVSE